MFSSIRRCHDSLFLKSQFVQCFYSLISEEVELFWPVGASGQCGSIMSMMQQRHLEEHGANVKVAGELHLFHSKCLEKQQRGGVIHQTTCTV